MMIPFLVAAFREIDYAGERDNTDRKNGAYGFNHSGFLG
jgi:hypothetical protein